MHNKDFYQHSSTYTLGGGNANPALNLSPPSSKLNPNGGALGKMKL